MMQRFARPFKPMTLVGVSYETWRCFAAAMEVQPVSAVSSTGGLGAYAIQPRRLVELGGATRLRYEGEDGCVQVCDFVAPMTRERFLSDLRHQYGVFARSIMLYDQQLERGELVRPEGATRAETLAALHIAGRGVLKDWANMFERTRLRCNAVREIF